MHQSTGDPTEESLPSRRALFDGIPRTPLVQNALALPGLTPVPVLPSTPMVPTPSNPIPKPPPAVPHPARRRGRTEVIKPNDSSAQALLVMLQKSHDRQEQSQLEDRRVAEKKSDQKEVARVQAKAEADHDQAMREGQLQIDRDLADKRNQLLDEEHRAREADRKEERRLDMEWRAEEGRRYEASQQQLAADRKDQEKARRAQEQSSQLFQAALMRMLGVGGVMPQAEGP
ncbi:uncharacterized protein PGTG_21002 [Puccinia graminis f. sp. tritici CRL 75-36-700-3]|uniref:Uncharacterized protein n=1 Tax=Puccinia graminis f. sp. tritici (strain CRL 75-36-700-3 / race SCCL) TaxID=418459 RepID=H6QQ50_PUCGT|nr:uncharacterized protein PGTG_21002 [Puccinia graminis f. sp. tritici CRL 75-36-700-3]EHS64651.1 hypothetical protein PGTG_21002 [Puccinia graminis f. sp. tritici CRL 75-36-700-3]